MKTLIEEITNDLYTKAIVQFESTLRRYIKDSLVMAGYEFFYSDTDFESFCKDRIYRLSFDDKPHYYELYLDFVDNENRGSFLCCYSDEMHCTYEGGTLKVTIG